MCQPAVHRLADSIVVLLSIWPGADARTTARISRADARLDYGAATGASSRAAPSRFGIARESAGPLSRTASVRARHLRVLCRRSICGGTGGDPALFNADSLA